MTHSHRRKTSSNHYFRMDVPKDIQKLVGKTSWQRSLDTSDPTLADARRAFYAAKYKTEIIRLRGVAAANFEKLAEEVVEKAFDGLATSMGSMDRAVAAELESLALTVRSSWSPEDALQVEIQQLGEEVSVDWEVGDGAIAVFDDEQQQRLFKLRADLFETREETFGLVYQELARSLLERGLHDPIQYQVACIAYDSDALDITSRPAFQAVARAYLKRLAAHEFASWPDGIREALAPIVDARSIATEQAKPVSAAPPSARRELGRTLHDAFELWKSRKGLTGEHHKTADEFATVLKRFELLCGTVDLAEIDTDMIKRFRSQVAQLPFRPGKELKKLSLTDQIAFAHKESLPTLSPPTVGKHITGIRAVMSEAVEAKWIANNPASGVTVDGAKWEGTERDHFSDDDMRLIYTSPLLTDADTCSDTMFWILFLAPFHGSRPGEHCKLKTHEIVSDGGEWLIRIRADRRRRSLDPDAPVTRPRKQKTKSSIRDIPVHWILIEAGFLDFVEVQKNRGSEWLFDDLEADKYGDRYKYLSREINDALRRLGIADPDKSFYSTRHSMKREGRRRGISSFNLNRMSGNATGNVGDRYGQGTPADVLKDDIDRLEFRSVPWDVVVACARQRLARLKRRYGSPA